MKYQADGGAEPKAYVLRMDAGTYQRLRLRAALTDQTVRQILLGALAQALDAPLPPAALERATRACESTGRYDASSP